jgi:5-oxoprolinase (ATP-hydrolysing)
MGLADQIAMRESALERELNEEGLRAAVALAERLLKEAAEELRAQGLAGATLNHVARIYVRYQGTDTALPCRLPMSAAPATTVPGVHAEFEEIYRRRFEFVVPDQPLMIESVSVECIAPGAQSPLVESGEPSTPYEPTASAAISMYCLEDARAAGWREAKLFQASELRAGARIVGPAILADRNATTVVEAGWEANMVAGSCIELRRVRAAGGGRELGLHADPILLELFNNIFMNVAEQMGLRLQNTAYSVNIKERLDFSCALFDAAGALIANAPHMPVHLGSMGESIRTVIERNPDMRSGDVYVLNDPYHGGTHLPDVTVVTPVYLDARADTPSFFVASRGHHADIGGITPGSMPPFSVRIEEEGVLIDNFKLVDGGILREAAMRDLLERGAHPSRNPAQNLADMRAQIAANAKGSAELKALVSHYGAGTVRAYMQHVQDNAEESVRRVITSLKDGDFVLPMDNGAQIKVALRVDTGARSAHIDFSGTSAQLHDNFNAPSAVTTAAVLYVFRTLINDDLPLNAGCLKPLRITLPRASMLSPQSPGAVVAGNVETSMCVTNALYGALGVMAAGCCTMSNFTFGNGRYQYYETIAGGSGAGPEFNGTSVVQTHMTNSRLTDPEVLEFRFPVRLESYEIRARSGGGGRWQGGNGGVRRIRFLEPMTASILSNGRKIGAFGMAGGEPGAVGENFVERADGRIEKLQHIGQVDVHAGDVMVICTPGGGGYGKYM